MTASPRRAYRVVVYSPDRHLLYDPAIAERDGVGGGLTARLRLARALASQGCSVTVLANLKHRVARNGVEYVPLNESSRLEGDVLILSSTGGAFDLSPALALDVRASLRMVWVNSLPHLQGLESVPWDHVVTPSNYVRHVVGGAWGVPRDRLLVIHNGVPVSPRRKWFKPLQREPFRLIYTSHPSKGFKAALELLRLLRRQDRRFELHVFGGRRLWGEADEPFDPPEGVSWHGLVGQERLGEELRIATFSIHLQGAPEAFGIALAEAMAAGGIVVASPVGAYAELVRDGHDGFLVDGSYDEPATLAKAARLILSLTRTPELAAAVQRNAAFTPLRWPTVARAWIGLWDRLLGGDQESWEAIGNCGECGATAYALADGYHCSGCGRFSREALGWRA